MAIKDSREWTVIVMRPGRDTRSYAVGAIKRGFTALMLVVAPLATLVVGYHWGSEHKLDWLQGNMAAMFGDDRTAPALASAAATSSPKGDVRAATKEAAAPEALAGAPSAEMDGEPQADDSAEPQELGDIEAQGESENDEPLTDADGNTLAVQLMTASGEIVEIHPLTEQGKPIREAFAQIRDAMGCDGGTHVLPNARLVRLLVDAHQRFKTPVKILGGHCAAHDDRVEAKLHHTQGRAADIRVRGVSSARLTTWLEEQEVGGVGRYARKGFVHVDMRSGDSAKWEAESTQASKARKAPRRAPAAPEGGQEQVAPEPERVVPEDDADESKTAGPAVAPTGAKDAKTATRAKAVVETTAGF